MKPVRIDEIIVSRNFPSLPAVAVQILKLLQDPDVGFRSLTAVVSQDAALTSKILRQANSSFYARSRTVSKLSEAFMVLGLRQVKTLALGFSLVNNKRGTEGGFDFTAFWRRSLYAAVGARGIASRTAGVDAEEAFLGGLLHGLGVLAFQQVVGLEYLELFDRAGGDYFQLLELESSALGFDHAELGGRLAEDWKLPRELTAAVRWSPTPHLAEDSVRPLVACVSVGSAAADVFVCNAPAPAVARYRDRCSQQLQMSIEESARRLMRIPGEFADMRSLLDLPEEESVNISDVLLRATEVLVELGQPEQVQRGCEKLHLPVDVTSL